jgi:hypothetical protein
MEEQTKNHALTESLLNAGLAVGYAEGDTCNRDGCVGIIDTHPPENCSCHLSAPCSRCTGPRNFCPECDWSEELDG